MHGFFDVFLAAIFLRAWSSVQRLIATAGAACALALESELTERWGEAKAPRPVLWPLVLRVGPLAD